MRISFAVLGLATIASALNIEQLAPINVIDNSRGRSRDGCSGGYNGGACGCSGGCGGCGGGCDPCKSKSSLALVHQVIMKEMELEMLKKEKNEKKLGADQANQMSEVDAAMGLMNSAQVAESEDDE